MEFTLTVTSNNPAELAKLLSGISGGSLAPVATPRAGKNEETQKTTTHASDSSVVSEGAITVTLEMVREKTAEKAQAGKKDAIKKLLAEFNAPNAASLAKENWEDFYNKLSKL